MLLATGLGAGSAAAQDSATGSPPAANPAAATPAASGPAAVGDQPALISADEITYDEPAGIVTASGSVEISQNGRVLVADDVSYDTRNDIVTAQGNVAIIEPTGDVFFADHMQVTGDLREGFVRDIRVLMSDRSRMAAVSGKRTNGNRFELSKTVYSPCEPCAEDPESAPLWQVKARRAVWDQNAKVVSYYDAWLEFFGIPVAYTPYFEHADPTVKRESGFLAPTFNSSSALGFTAEVPYFVVLSDTADVTISPIFTSKQGVVGKGEYRQLFEKGYLDIGGSFTWAELEKQDGVIESDVFRGNIAAKTFWDIDDTYRAGVEINRTTDDTYLRVYNLGSQSTLVSQAFVEGFEGRSYSSLRSIAYQVLREQDNQSEQPFVVPLGEYSYISEPGQWGGVYSVDTTVLSLLRDVGLDTRRLATDASWTLPYTSDDGHVFSFTAGLLATGYWTTDFDPDDPDNINPGNNDNLFSGRLFPQVALKWSYPLVRQTGSMRQIVEPIVQGRLAPPTGDQDNIPNEDSQDIEFTTQNLFSLNRFPGVDRVDPGPRLDYGLRWSATGDSGGYTSVMLGQSYHPMDSDDVFGPGTGLDGHRSDYVGNIQISPATWLDLGYNFRLDKNDFAFRYNELSAYMGVPELNLEIGYLYADELLSPQDSEVLEDRNELYAKVGSQFTKEWSGFVSHRQDFANNVGLSTRLGLQYADECFTIQTIFERSNYEDRELEPDNTVFVRIVLRNLGDLSTN